MALNQMSKHCMGQVQSFGLRPQGKVNIVGDYITINIDCALVKVVLAHITEMCIGVVLNKISDQFFFFKIEEEKQRLDQ